jgi:hypothetical protein
MMSRARFATGLLILIAILFALQLSLSYPQTELQPLIQATKTPTKSATATHNPSPTFAPTGLWIAALYTSQTRIVDTFYQPFENGFMLWFTDYGAVHVASNNGYLLTYSYALHHSLHETPIADPKPDGLLQPTGVFGKVWSNYLDVRLAVGWATAPEQEYVSTMMQYFRATLPDGRTIWLLSDHLISYIDGRQVKDFSVGTWNFEDGSLPPTVVILSIPTLTPPTTPVYTVI